MELNNIINYVKNNGGITLDLNLNKIDLQKGYIVSLENYEKKLYISNITIDTDGAKSEIFKTLLEKISQVKNLKKAPCNRSHKYYIGMWTYNNELYIDINIHMMDYKKARSFGISQNQYSIYDVKNDNSIMLTQKTYILYEYNHKNNDLRYIYEFINQKDVANYLHCNNAYLNTLISKSIDVLDITKLFKNKYAIIEDSAFYRDLNY